MGAWSTTKARRVLAALLRIGWVIVRQRGSHRRLSHPTRGLYGARGHRPRSAKRVPTIG
ncbi:MAG: type II toxin-antitoxin system HicA family toxin, partial [Myxococcales bacterium]|nr:type II toxin-antitoxin system HicA family toxin [Myxococcales bacterium]